MWKSKFKGKVLDIQQMVYNIQNSVSALEAKQNDLDGFHLSQTYE